MSTRSIVAIPDADGWRGRYVHSDGYPKHMGKTLHDEARRHGARALGDRLVNAPDARMGWSFLGVSPTSPSLMDPGVWGDYCSPRSYAVRGEDGIDLRTSQDPPETNADIEWLYILSDAGLIVCRRTDIATGKLVPYDVSIDWNEWE